MQDTSNYQREREKAHEFYQKIGGVYSPVLEDKIHFNAEGFNHLIYKGRRKERPKTEQMMKFKLLPRAKTILEKSTTYQEYDEGLTTVERKKHKKRVQEAVVTRYWGFVAIEGNSRMKVVVRQAGNGQKHFWSVIPAWSSNQYKGIKLTSRAKGDLAEE